MDIDRNEAVALDGERARALKFPIKEVVQGGASPAEAGARYGLS